MPRDRRDGISTYKGKFRISYIDGQGRRKQKKIEASTITQARTIRAAMMIEAERQRALGYIPPSEDSFTKFAVDYLKHQKARISPKGYERCQGIIEKRLKPVFGAKRLSDIRRDDVEKYVTKRRVEVSKATVAKELTILKHLLSIAVAKEKIFANVAHGVKPYDKPPEYRTEYLLPEQLPPLLAQCPEWLQPIVLLLVATGMRRGELLGLRWGYLKLGQKQILLPTTKNGKPRVVHLNALACRVLESLTADEVQADDFVFSDKAYYSPENVSIAFSRACREAKIANFRLHDLRHTCASWMAMKGIDIHTIATQLGHDVRQSARYAHLSGTFLQGAVRTLDGVFKPELLAAPAPLAKELQGFLALRDTAEIPIEQLNAN
jgi:integrase